MLPNNTKIASKEIIALHSQITGSSSDTSVTPAYLKPAAEAALSLFYQPVQNIILTTPLLSFPGAVGDTRDTTKR